MKKRDLLDMLGDIDPDMIDDAAPDFSKKRRKKRPQNTYMKAIAIAACCTLILCGAMVAAPVINKIVYPDVATTDTGETGSVQATEDGHEGNNGPIYEPTSAPAEEPTVTPTDDPVVEDTHAPTEAPTDLPIEIPTEQATSNEEEPTGAATEGATRPPTGGPIEEPTEGATRPPTGGPIEETTEGSYPEPSVTISVESYEKLNKIFEISRGTLEEFKEYQKKCIEEKKHYGSFTSISQPDKIKRVADWACSLEVPVLSIGFKGEFGCSCNVEDLSISIRHKVNDILYSFAFAAESLSLRDTETEIAIEDAIFGNSTIDIYNGEGYHVGVKHFDGYSVRLVIFTDDETKINMDVFDFVMLSDIPADDTPDLDNEEPTAEPTVEPTDAPDEYYTEAPSVEPDEMETERFEDEYEVTE